MRTSPVPRRAHSPTESALSAGHDVSDGGLVTCLLEMAFAGNCGLQAQLDASGATREYPPPQHQTSYKDIPSHPSHFRTFQSPQHPSTLTPTPPRSPSPRPGLSAPTLPQSLVMSPLPFPVDWAGAGLTMKRMQEVEYNAVGELEGRTQGSLSL